MNRVSFLGSLLAIVLAPLGLRVPEPPWRSRPKADERFGVYVDGRWAWRKYPRWTRKCRDAASGEKTDAKYHCLADAIRESSGLPSGTRVDFYCEPWLMVPPGTARAPNVGYCYLADEHAFKPNWSFRA